jgi:hypothetical protein
MQMLSMIRDFAIRAKRRLSFDTYELCGDEILAHRGLREPYRVRVSEIESWVSYPEMTFDAVEIRLTGGGSLVWLDRQNDLLRILRAEAKLKERTQ